MSTGRSSALKVSVTGKVLTEDRAGVVGALPDDLPPEVFLRPTAADRGGQAAPRARRGARTPSAAPTLDKLHRLTAAIHAPDDVRHRPTEVDTSAEPRPMPRAMASARISPTSSSPSPARIGIPARYISGHLFRRDGAAVQEAGHAWAEAWIERSRLGRLRPVNGICTDDAYIRVAAGLDYRDAAPFAGARNGGGREELKVEVQVRQAGRDAVADRARRSQAQSQTQN